MKSKFEIVLLVLSLTFTLSLTACSQGKIKPPDTPANKETPESAERESGKNASVEVLAEGLRTPWALDFQGSTMYVSEREGTIAKIEGTSVKRQEVRLRKPLLSEGEGGFLGFVLAPDFTVSKLAFAYHTYKDNGTVWNRVVVLKENAGGWTEQQALLERIPGSLNHNGGRLALGPDKQLYVTTGDSNVPDLAQDLSSLAGKILRMTSDGQVPKDNPFPESYVYSYGHRNSQGIAWTSDGAMYASEHGPSGSPAGHDEMNRIQAGANYGWPLVIGDERREGMLPPLYHTGREAIAPSGIAIGGNGPIYVAALRGEALFRYEPETKSINAVLQHAGRLRDVKVHGGYVYVLTNNTDGRGVPKAGDDRLMRMKE
ncbi:PQQ-dependent sugar dehydrogenase [Paenibacillus validus]|uniref:PQQ-dependent sugar dehydrogenase n=1 Tax=Paenibacillus validus TaxID=44253 RepID=UPI002E7B5380|nr:PQQ-dependent sugar dehydrogenase [Paenibacillus validus]